MRVRASCGGVRRHGVASTPALGGSRWNTFPAAGTTLTAPRHLLTWRTDPAAEATVTYSAEVQDYYAAPRTLVEDLPPIGTTSGPLSARTVTAPVTDETRTAGIEVTHDGTTARVDLGQALRGHRYAHRPDPASDEAHSDVTPRTAAAWSALRAPGLVWTQAGDVTLDATGQDDLVVPALLGRLYPENVTLRPVGRSTARTTAGGTGPNRLVTLVDPPQAH
ncbi:hypothetical protein ACFWXA_24345 [Streptomyces atroolivaceus]|uniref:hypothetical protein n=1 Tax=Streptomyces atroolivaceus TaxID=66869 RepID=UPI00365D61A1